MTGKFHTQSPHHPLSPHLVFPYSALASQCNIMVCYLTSSHHTIRIRIRIRIRIYLLARRNLLWDILRLPSSRRAALGLYVILTLWRGRDANQPPYALLHRSSPRYALRHGRRQWTIMDTSSTSHWQELPCDINIHSTWLENPVHKKMNDWKIPQSTYGMTGKFHTPKKDSKKSHNTYTTSW